MYNNRNVSSYFVLNSMSIVLSFKTGAKIPWTVMYSSLLKTCVCDWHLHLFLLLLLFLVMAKHKIQCPKAQKRCLSEMEWVLNVERVWITLISVLLFIPALHHTAPACSHMEGSQHRSVLTGYRQKEWALLSKLYTSRTRILRPSSRSVWKEATCLKTLAFPPNRPLSASKNLHHIPPKPVTWSGCALR